MNPRTVDRRLIFEKSVPGRRGHLLPPLDVPTHPVEDLIPERFLRTQPPRLPELSEGEVVRHFVGLARLNYGVDNGFYPLGSCTMKYNPKINEAVAGLPGFAHLHPLGPEEASQGALRLMWALEEALKEIAGMDAVTLQPAAGAHGELTGMLVVRAYHEDRGDPRETVVIPDSAHGTNPASAAMAGYRTVVVPSNAQGCVDLKALAEVVDERCAALMLTNPNTLGLFEKDILEIARIVHDAGALLYLDGANLNALLGLCRPGDMGFDLVHFNLHKTFSTPHGGGGPGAGPLGVVSRLEPYLPVPRVVREGERFRLDMDRPKSIGRVHTFYGNFGVLVRAYTYIRRMGAEGLSRVSRMAILNANYVRKRLEPYFDLPQPRPCMHECVFSARRQKKQGVSAWDIVKRLQDYGFHPPTVYFPLIVDEALMIEPTETENRQTLDAFCDALIAIAREVETDPQQVQTAPHTQVVRRVDEARAVKQPDLRWTPPES